MKEERPNGQEIANIMSTKQSDARKEIGSMMDTRHQLMNVFVMKTCAIKIWKKLPLQHQRPRHTKVRTDYNSNIENTKSLQWFARFKLYFQ